MEEQQPYKSHKQRQAEYRLRQKERLGSDAYKAEQAQKMREYRASLKANTTIEETKLTNKETRNRVNQLLETIRERVITMIEEQKQNPQIPIRFEDHIRREDIAQILVDINNQMSNQDVINAFVENERKNPRNAKKTASKDTFTKYLDDINNIRKIYFGIDDKKLKVYNDFGFLKDTPKVLKILKDKYSHTTTSYSTMVNSISAILARLNHYNDVYTNVYKPLNIELAIKKKKEILDSENKLSEKEKKVFRTWDIITSEETENAVEDSPVNPSENLALYYLYTQLPPRRLEYGSLIIAIDGQFQDDGKSNYVVLDPKQTQVRRIILNTYKTSKTYGKYVISPIPEKLSDAIIILIDEQGYKAGEYLFMNSKGKPYVGASFSARLKQVFEQSIGIPITLNVLRHSFISYKIKQGTTAKQKAEWASAMGHSTEQQDLYRRYEAKELGV